MPTIQGIDTFAHGIFSSAGGGLYSAVHGAPTRDTGVVYGSDPASLKVADAGAGVYVRNDLSTPSIAWQAFRFRCDTRANGEWISRINATNSFNLALQMTNSGAQYTLTPNLNAGTLGTASGLLNTGQWYWIEIIYDLSGATYSVYWQIDGVSQTTLTSGGHSATTGASVDFGSLQGSNDLFYYSAAAWGSAANSTDWAGTLTAEAHSPNAVGTHNLDASPSAYFFANVSAVNTAITSSETTSYQTIDDVPLDADSDHLDVQGVTGTTVAFRAASAKAAGTGAVTPALPTGVTSGDMVILVATTIAGGSNSITANGSISSWTALSGSPIDVASGEKLYVWYGFFTSGATGPTVTPGSDHCCAATFAYSGVNSASPIDGSATGTETTSDTSFSFAPGFSTTIDNDLVICICSTGADSNTAQFTTMTNASLGSIAERADYCTNSGGGGGFALDDGTLATHGSVGTWASTLSTATPKAYISFGIAPVVTSNPTTAEYLEYLLSTTASGDASAVRVINSTRNDSGTTANKISAKIRDGSSDGAVYTDLSIASASNIYKTAVFTTKPSGGAWTQAAFNALKFRWGFTDTPTNIPRLEGVMVEALFAPQARSLPFAQPTNYQDPGLF